MEPIWQLGLEGTPVQPGPRCVRGVHLLPAGVEAGPLPLEMGKLICLSWLHGHRLAAWQPGPRSRLWEFLSRPGCPDILQACGAHD